MNRQEMGGAYFKEGYNCAQSVVLAFKDMLDMDEASLIKASAPFGGGLAKMREVCGAVSGMAMVLGLLYAHIDSSPESKAEIYERAQEVVRRFEAEQGSIICRDLLELDVRHEAPVPAERNAAYYETRPCERLVRQAISYVEDYIKKNPY